MMPLKNPKAAEKFDDLIEVIKKLRAPGGCDWDRAQTSASLVPYLLEETYEVIEAIEEKDTEALKEELGDLSLHIIFQAELAEEKGDFTMAEALAGVSEKLIRRHPHVFGNEKNTTITDQNESWEKAKQKEKKRKNFLDGVPKNLPALTRARRIQEKASHVGFDWKEIDPVWDKVHEEIGELKEAVAGGNQESIKDELGDVFFSLVNLGRFLDVSGEDALRMTIAKFENRFAKVEVELKSRGSSMENSTLDEMDEIWNDIKKGE
jgi:tetrapyrrole methylase family protein/MazG family protein